MKKVILFLLAIVCMASCAKKQETRTTRHPMFAYDATIYELNTRQFTPEGTFIAAEEELPKLKDMGVNIIWIMPIQPIGKITRKGTLGSYYSIRDYCAFNPEFGSRADFEHFLATAHELGMKVILDWVANHTAPDSEWAKNDGWHYRDENGKLMVQYDWTDIAKLNYENEDMRAEMKKAMHWWMDEIGIDGFRCDVAGEVPTDFWNDIMAELRETHPDMFTLAEDEDKAPELCETAFDMYYGWTLHHLMNGVAQGTNTVEDLWDYFAKADSTVEPYAIRMNFISNHDENSWAGDEYERMGAAVEAMTALSYVIPGMPLIYTGQEYGNHHRLEFFEKDCIDRDENCKMRPFYKALNDIRKGNPALHSPELGAPMVRLEANNDKVFAIARKVSFEQKCMHHYTTKTNTVLAIINMSNEVQDVDIHTDAYIDDYMSLDGSLIEIPEVMQLSLKPWQYIILTDMD